MKMTRGYIVAVHCISWLIFLSLPAVFIAGQSGVMQVTSLLKPVAWFYFSSFIFIFYLHTYLLFPRFYFRKKYVLYFCSLLLLTVAIFYLKPYDRLAGWDKMPNNHTEIKKAFPSPHPDMFRADSGMMAKYPEHSFGRGTHRGRPKLDIISMVLFILIIALSITISIVKRWRHALDMAARAETDKVNAELSFLKAQIDPHFLFNTLNNIYSLAVTKDENTAESIMKLSHIMRYVTDEARDHFVSLRSETSFITDYIELQRLRLGSKVSLDFAISGNLRDKVIAPLILTTFIENVFKYGISNNEPSVISINLKADDNTISFSCRNRLFPLKHKLDGMGIGIANTKKRLEYLYPGRHILNIKNEDGFYSVHLILQT